MRITTSPVEEQLREYVVEVEVNSQTQGRTVEARSSGEATRKVLDLLGVGSFNTAGWDGFTVSFSDGCDHNTLDALFRSIRQYTVQVTDKLDLTFTGSFHLEQLGDSTSSIHLTKVEHDPDTVDAHIPFTSVKHVYIY